MGRPPIGEQAMTAAERQRRRREKLAESRNESQNIESRNESRNGVTITVGDRWREPLANSAGLLGVPAGEYADLLMALGQDAFNRKFQSGLTNEIAWWLIEMHSKYPDTFNVGSWEGSCGHLAIDKLYEARGIPVGKFQEWEAERTAKEDEIAKKKAAWAQKMEASGMADKMAIDRELKRERKDLKAMESPDSNHYWPSKKHRDEALARSRKRIQALENARQGSRKHRGC
jgi:hypothetical protein